MTVIGIILIVQLVFVIGHLRTIAKNQVTTAKYTSQFNQHLDRHLNDIKGKLP